MKERPIIFSAPMVRAILSGRKTVTRRLVKLPASRGEWEPSSVGGDGCVSGGGEPAPETPCIWNTTTGQTMACPYGAPKDRLWVKETFQPFWSDPEIRPETRWKDGPEGYRINYVADTGPEPYEHEDDLRLTPSIYMPRWASRITLEVVSVRAERLHEITAEDAEREGADDGSGRGPRLYPGTGAARGPLRHRAIFAELWDKLNGKRAPWSTNPWVWRVEFRRIT